MLIILMTACSNEDENRLVHDDTKLEGKGDFVTLSSQVKDVSVLIFGEKDDAFNYQSKISSGWDANNQVQTKLKLGEYKFLFIKTAGDSTTLFPTELKATTKFEDIHIKVNDDALHPGYVKPVDQIYFPETTLLADSVYTITGPTTVKNKLTRAVGQVVVNVHRVAKNGNDTTHLPFTKPQNVMDNIGDITLDISGIGEYINIKEGKGSVKTFYTFDNTKAKIDAKGFASLEGPFLFPTVDENKTIIKVTVNPASDSPFPILKTEVESRVKRNEQIIITLLVTSTYQLIDISVDVEPMSDVHDGDSGIWE
ncbi:FimB/Mfa2 family fimbrial subunit [Prevotella sp. 10(H)]|uniref:FimB/Mfa2 family fimbrial subunit n=1 Tax=Prevotella sp. 10(H) TaxID=1158294 RepID=UPI0012DD996C|nr:FimB/Mfa2 family fimbrial subunit [Prevotella sp. 10(H)]